MAVWLGQLLRYLIQLPGLWQLREFYTNLLLIPDEDMQTLQWSTVMHKITHLRAHTPSIINASPSLNLDAHTITNRIMRKENYLIALFNKEMIPLGFCDILTTSLEWNLKFCLFNCLFDKNGQVRPAFVQGATSREQQHHLVKDLCKRFRLMAILNGLFAPFVLLYLLLFFFFRYFKEYQNSPSEMGSRSYTLLARWKLREFNELEHLFEQRLRKSYPKAMLYLDEFPKEKTVMFARFLSFISGSVAGVLALMAIYHQELLLNFHFTQEGTLFFYLGLFGTIFALSRGLVPDENIVFDPKRRLLDVVEDTHYLPDGWRNRLETDQVRQQFNNMFQLKVLGLLYELWGVLWTPFVLWRDLANPRSVEMIMDFFRTFSVHVDGLGYICSFAEFNFERNGNIKYGVPTQLNDAYFVSNEGKMEKSFLNFKATYPDWVPQDATGSMFLSKLQELKPSRNASAPGLRGILKRRSDSTGESNPTTKKEPEQLDRMAGMLDTMDLRAMKRHNNFVGSASVHENLNYQKASSSTQTSLSKSVIISPTTTNQDPLHLEWSTGKLSVASAVNSGNGYSSDGEESSSSSATSQDARQNDPGVFSLLNRFYAADELMELQHPPSML